ncbi:ARID DNA-binding domain-containing protein [Tanacetum coccineum]|uniref:ARID DNA-binding domain-containing protein n=1 Tax=Tanacetum coccineum TaxID=301880 RepID=A0ABQ4XTQ5_9ASTR
MVHYKHIMQHNWLGYKPVQKWYQYHGSEPWEKPIHKHDQAVHTRRYLQRETPKRLFPWNSRKKSSSPESKEMLVKKMKEVEVFNASKMSAKTRDHGKKIESTPEGGIEKQKKSVKPTNKNVAEKIKYLEKVHVITDYMIEGTDDAIGMKFWYLEAREGNLVIPNVHYTPEVTLNVLSFDLLEEQGYTDYVDEEYISWNGSLYALKVNSFASKKYVEMLKWLYLVYLNYDMLEEIPPVIGVMEINLLSLHKIVDSLWRVLLCGHPWVTDGDKLLTIQGLTKDDGEAVVERMIQEGKAQEESFTEDDGSKDVVTEHNKFLDEYFESIDPKEECSLVNGLEDLKWDRNDIQDYVDEEYISWNGSLYALKVNSFARFLSFLNLIKKDSMVYKHWDIFSKKYVEMLKWFYLVYLNYDMLEEIPPVIGVMEINLLSLHKIVDSLGGYLCVTLGDKWKTIANLQGLTKDDGEAVKGCYKKFIDMVQVYYETAKMPWYEKKPKEDVVESSSGNARVKDPQGKEKDDAGIEEALEEDMNKKTQFGVRLEGNMEEEAEEGSTTDSNDFVVII